MEKLQHSLDIKPKDTEECVCEKQEVCSDNAIKKTSSLSELSHKDLLKKAQEYRKCNINLLEQNRFLFLELQAAKKAIQQNFKMSSFNKEPSENISNESNLPNVCTCGAGNKLDQVIMVNHMWQNDYNKLKEELAKANALLEDYRTQVTSLNRINDIQINSLKDSKKNSEFTFDDIEAFKQQMQVYKEDFDANQVIISKLQHDLSEMKIELNQSQEFSKDLMRKNESAKNNFDRVNIENVHILSQLRRLTSQSLSLKLDEKTTDLSRSPTSPRGETKARSLPHSLTII